MKAAKKSEEKNWKEDFWNSSYECKRAKNTTEKVAKRHTKSQNLTETGSRGRGYYSKLYTTRVIKQWRYRCSKENWWEKLEMEESSEEGLTWEWFKKKLIAQRDHYRNLASVWKARWHRTRQDEQIPPKRISAGES